MVTPRSSWGQGWNIGLRPHCTGPCMPGARILNSMFNREPQQLLRNGVPIGFKAPRKCHHPDYGRELRNEKQLVPWHTKKTAYSYKERLSPTKLATNALLHPLLLQVVSKFQRKTDAVEQALAAWSAIAVPWSQGPGLSGRSRPARLALLSAGHVQEVDSPGLAWFLWEGLHFKTSRSRPGVSRLWGDGWEPSPASSTSSPIASFDTKPPRAATREMRVR